MANENLCEMAPDGQAQVKTRLTNRSNWLGLSLIVAAITTLIPLITIVVFEWYFFTVVDGLATCLSPITKTFRRIEGHPQTKPPGRSPTISRPSSITTIL
jgi:hypothetical protein